MKIPEKLNIVQIRIGKYDERNDDFSKNKAYALCYQSLLDRCKNDNLMIFHSYGEVFDRFPGLKEKYYSYSDFLNSPQVKARPLWLSGDLLRLLLTEYIDDMLYVDADIYLEKNFKEKFFSMIKDPCDFAIRNCGISFFYSRHKNQSIINYIDSVFNSSYQQDVSTWENNRAKLELDESVQTICCESVHFFNYDYIKRNIKEIVFIDEPLENLSFDLNEFLIVKGCHLYARFDANKGIIEAYYWPKDLGNILNFRHLLGDNIKITRYKNKKDLYEHFNVQV